MNWAKQYTQHLNKIGFQKGRASACNFVHESRNIRLTCHGDDFIIVALCKEIERLVREMEKEYELKFSILGPEAGLSKEVRVLNRSVRWTPDSIQYECDRRHADIVVGLLGMEGMQRLSSLGLTEITDCFKEEEDKKEGNAEVRKRALEHGSDSLFRALTARINFFAQDRADLVFASNCVSHFMSELTPAAWLALKRIGRYLIGARRILQTFKWGEISGHIEGYGDSDWAGDNVSRRSTRGGALIWNGDVLKTWSVRQKTIALSSAEAELYAMTKCATQTLGMIQLMQDFMLKDVVHTDSFAALGIVSRVGIGRTRHIQVQYLWLQERLLKNDLRAVKIGGKFNVSDIMTKYLKREDIDKILRIMSMQVHDSQSCIASIQTQFVRHRRRR